MRSRTSSDELYISVNAICVKAGLDPSTFAYHAKRRQLRLIKLSGGRMIEVSDALCLMQHLQKIKPTSALTQEIDRVLAIQANQNT